MKSIVLSHKNSRCEERHLEEVAVCTPENNGKPSKRGKYVLPVRVLVAILACFGVFCTNTLRLNVSLAIVAMVNASAIISHTHTNSLATPTITNPQEEASCPVVAISTSPDHNHVDKEGPFEWDEWTRGLILSSYFWGNVLTQLPGGVIADRFGGKWPFGLGILASALFSLLVPTAAFQDYRWVVVLRVLCGVAQGLALPALYSLLTRWVPNEERSRLTGLTYAGVSLGKVIVFPVSGALCDSDFLGGWPAAFYVFGGFGVIWFCCWAILVRDHPSMDPKVSPEELLHIQDHVTPGISGDCKEKVEVLWSRILTSSGVWALLIAYFGQAWGAHTLLTLLPTYLKFAMHFDMKSSGLVNGLPYILAFFSGLWACWMADGLHNSKRMTNIQIRKAFAATAMSVPMGCLVGVAFLGCQRVGVVVALTSAVAIANINAGGLFLNEMDLSLKAAGTLKGLTNLSSNFAGILAPYAAGFLVHDDSNIHEWRNVFLLSAGILLVGLVVFLAFGTAERQCFTKQEMDQSEDRMERHEEFNDNDDEKIPILSENNNYRSHGTNQT